MGQGKQDKGERESECQHGVLALFSTKKGFDTCSKSDLTIRVMATKLGVELVQNGSTSA